MGSARTVVIPHLGRVEGHGGIFVRLSGNTVTEVDMTIHEGTRFYEALLVGKSYDEVQKIICRVCAICSASHSVAALTGIENALGVAPSRLTSRLRELMVLGSTIESHALHLFALALPDFLGYDSVLAMASDHKDIVTDALRLKQLGNEVQEVVGGRAVHAVNALVGGFASLPSQKRLAELAKKLENMAPFIVKAADLLASLNVPDWPRQDTVFLALDPGPRFGFLGDAIRTSRGEEYPVADYREVVQEKAVRHSHAKHAFLNTGETYVVGALARLVLFSDRLSGLARDVFSRLFPEGAVPNILFNNHAQLVELAHCVEEAASLASELAQEKNWPGKDVSPYSVVSGRGVGALEAPRGLLIHEYVLDQTGMVTDANVITPTAQNLANAERDLRIAAERLIAEGKESQRELKLGLEMVARAYDPCISCSVHVAVADEGG